MKVILAFFLITSQVSKYRTNLKRLKKDLQAAKTRLYKIKKEKKGVESDLAYLEEKEKAIVKFLDFLKKSSRKVSLELEALDKEIAKREKILEKDREDIRSSIVLLYKLSGIKEPINYYLFLPQDEKSARNRVLLNDYLKRVVVFRRNEYERVIEEYRELADIKKLKEEHLALLLEMRDEEDRERLELAHTRIEKETYLKTLKERERRERKRIRDLLASIRKMEKLIKKLEAERARLRKKRGQIARKPHGIYPWPVRGKIVSYYGTIWHPKYKTKVKNNGIDIKVSSPNAPVRSIENGTVIFAEPYLGYGNTVIIDHGGFFSVYTQLAQINVKKGDNVTKGQLIGRIGDPNTGYILHFEIRVGGKSVNPLKYLRSS